MRKRTALLAAAAGGVGLAAATASGFPRRLGVTLSGTDLSLPGDLLLPAAQTVADRAHEFSAPAEALWPELLAVEDLYSFLWEAPLELIVEEPGQFAVWRTASTDGWKATLTAALLPGTDGHTTVHLRERYHHQSDRMRIAALVMASASVAPLTWFRLRRATK